MENDKKVNSTAKALKILDCFTENQAEYTLSQLSRKMNMPKSTLLNHLRTMEEDGFLLKSDSNQTYRLGYKIMHLAYELRIATPIIQYALPILEEIQQTTGEFVYLTTMLDGMVFYLECMYPTVRSVGYSVSGKMLPMHCTSCGKAMLSKMPREEVLKIIEKKGLPRITEHTITDRDELLKELDATNERGYAIDVQEETIGVKCIAMPIMAPSGKVAGAISISGSCISMKDSLYPEYAKILSRSCNSLARYSNLFPAIMMDKAN